MSTIIKEATTNDISNITYLIHMLAIDGDFESPLTDDYALEFLSHSGCGVLLAECDGQIVGMLSYTVQPNLFHAGDTCTIQELVVDAKYRNRGIGSALINTILEKAEQSGFKEVSISAMPDNLKAITLYRSLGLDEEAVYLEKHL